ncbi:DVU_1556 family methyltransferase [Maledivibacter halophilus]|uniref:Methylase involved in ubiquinone/menaquinone biosynthesis n=1 Tax=Maledivibacter halophilus TaxID=36842 RepID=A0A1T5J5C0_9FIRM|nr:class I SAM-dependent methyltransferase [Maledivibacter halophilus]SKC46600.1 Methylase involved in ubiquinone/menaquinone biosynthesis [Maledivibacter halophilus]
MFSPSSISVYESKEIRDVTGDTIRPGGFGLTDKGVEVCKFNNNDRVLDIGCGTGATVEYLRRKYKLKAEGIDPSQKLLSEAKIKNPKLKLYKGYGEELPYEEGKMDGIFCECTLSLMKDKDKAIEEIHRVLKPGGYLFISDVYARRPQYITELKKFNFKSCITGIHNIEDLKKKLIEKNFEIKKIEDHTNYLEQMIVNIIFKYGSMAAFWKKVNNCEIHCNELTNDFKKVKIGYFLLIVQKT